jgi:hypothetical protein
MVFFLILKCFFFMAMFDLRVGWIHFHERSPRQTKKMFGYGGGLFVKLMGMQLFINKL